MICFYLSMISLTSFLCKGQKWKTNVSSAASEVPKVVQTRSSASSSAKVSTTPSRADIKAAATGTPPAKQSTPSAKQSTPSAKQSTPSTKQSTPAPVAVPKKVRSFPCKSFLSNKTQRKKTPFLEVQLFCTFKFAGIWLNFGLTRTLNCHCATARYLLLVCHAIALTQAVISGSCMGK